MKTSKFFSPIVLLLVKWSGIGLTDGRGKVGGTVLSKSRSGATARNKVTPINRRTSRQSAIRAVFASFSQQFRTLTTAQITAWNNAAQNGFSLRNIFGDTVQMSGLNLFVRLNTNIDLVSGTAITNPPSASATPVGIVAVDPQMDFSSSSLLATCNFIGGGVSTNANNAVLVYGTPPLSPGQQFVKSKLRLFTVIPPTTDTSATNLYSDYVDRFGAFATGDQIVLAVQNISLVSGISSTPVQKRGTVVA